MTAKAPAPKTAGRQDDRVSVLVVDDDEQFRMGLAKLLGRVLAPARAAAGDGALLSERELEVLQLLAHGKANADIARELFLSPHTVRNHISNILAKLQIANRTEATAYAIRSGLV